MTTPVLHWVYPRHLFEAASVEEEATRADYTVLIPISRPDSAPGLARIASLLTKHNLNTRVPALTLYGPLVNETLGAPVRSPDEVASQPMQALLRETGPYQLPVTAMVMASRDFASDISRVARSQHADLILMGYHKALLGQSILGGVVHRVLTGAETDVAVLVDRGLAQEVRILVPYRGTPHDRLAIDLVRRMASAPGVRVTILHVVPKDTSGRSEAPSIRKQKFPDSVEIWIIEEACPVEAVLRHSAEFDLVVVGLSEEWGFGASLLGLRTERIAKHWPNSLLLVRKYAVGDGLADPVDWTSNLNVPPGLARESSAESVATNPRA